MRKWTTAERKRQAQLIRAWQPWKLAGVKTQAGKAISRMNAYKHGLYSAEVKQIEKFLAYSKKINREKQKQINF